MYVLRQARFDIGDNSVRQETTIVLLSVFALAFAGRVQADEAGANLPEPVRLTYSSQQRQIEIQFPFQFQPEQVEGFVTFYRPSNSSMDYVLPIALSSERKQIIFTRNLADGLWRIKMSWQSEGLDYYHEEMMLQALQIKTVIVGHTEQPSGEPLDLGH